MEPDEASLFFRQFTCFANDTGQIEMDLSYVVKVRSQLDLLGLGRREIQRFVSL